MEKVRLDRFLSNNGFGTRTQIKKRIANGEVTVNGETERSPERRVLPDSDRVVCGGIAAVSSGPLYYMLYKSAGYVTATEDAHKQTVMDLAGLNIPDLFPVGRLDIDTEGLLLLTNDGPLAHRLLSPRRHIEKTYEALVTGKISDSLINAFLGGMDIGDPKKTLPAKLVVKEYSVPEAPAASDDAFYQNIHSLYRPEDWMKAVRNCKTLSRVNVSITEGRYHQIKRMFEAAGEKVLYLKRISMGPLVLDDRLEKGMCRALSEKEISLLRSI